MRARGSSYRSLLSSLIAAAVAVPSACGEKSDSNGQEQDASAETGSASDSGSSSGASTSSGGGGGCMVTTSTYPVDPTKCEPQVISESVCGGGVCGTFEVELPCVADGGPGADAAGVSDAGADASPNTGSSPSCDSLCRAVHTGAYVAGACFGPFAPPSGGSGFAVSCDTIVPCGGGRAPRGFMPREARAASQAGAYLASMAQLEAASVDAFHALYADLARLGAPRCLLAAVRAAARDEVRHARMVGSMAERFGARPPPVSVAAAPARSAEELAIENAEEGCVREAFGAAVVAAQAQRARDPRVRKMMRAIARDELGHAALAWRIAAWLDARLDAGARHRVREARVRALRALSAGIHDGQPRQDAVGLPGGRTTRLMLERMEPALASGRLQHAA